MLYNSIFFLQNLYILLYNFFHKIKNFFLQEVNIFSEKRIINKKDYIINGLDVSFFLTIAFIIQPLIIKLSLLCYLKINQTYNLSLY